MFTWTDQNTKQAISMWKAGKTSTIIAEVLGCTRNAAIGKVHRIVGRRMNVRVEPPKRVETQAPFRRRQDRVVRPKPQPDSFTPTMTLPSFEAVVMAGTCQFIDGDPHKGTAVYCGHERKAGSMYCAGHHAVCSRKVRVQR